MFDEVDCAYFARRAKEERDHAAAARHAGARQAHLELALAYERRAQAAFPPWAMTKADCH